MYTWTTIFQVQPTHLATSFVYAKITIFGSAAGPPPPHRRRRFVAKSIALGFREKINNHSLFLFLFWCYENINIGNINMVCGIGFIDYGNIVWILFWSDTMLYGFAWIKVTSKEPYIVPWPLVWLSTLFITTHVVKVKEVEPKGMHIFICFR